MKGKSNAYWKDVLARFVRHKLAVIGLIVILLEVFAVTALPAILQIDPNRSDFIAGIYAAPRRTERR